MVGQIALVRIKKGVDRRWGRGVMSCSVWGTRRQLKKANVYRERKRYYLLC